MIRLRKIYQGGKPYLFLLIEFIVIFLVVFFLVFMLSHALPDGIRAKLGPKATPEAIQQAKQQFDLDKPIITQFGIALARLFTQGSFGLSIETGTSVYTAIGSRPAVTLGVGFLGLFFAFCIGTTIGVTQSLKANKTTDVVLSWVTSILIAVPSFIIGTLFILSFVQFIPPVFDASNHPIASFVLPALALAIPSSAFYARYIRTTMTQELAMRYIDFAKTKGASKARIIFKHALKPALFPIVTYLPIALLNALVGEVVIEKVFSIPGVGNTLLTSIQASDYNIVVFIATLYSGITVLGYFLRDILYGLIDPRVRTKMKGE